MTDPEAIVRYYESGSDLMRDLLDAVAAVPDQRRTFSEVEDGLGWPRRRIASVLNGVWHLRMTEFGGRRPYRFVDETQSAFGRWEIWADAVEADAIRAAQLRQRKGTG
jgi:hypothetical protein